MVRFSPEGGSHIHTGRSDSLENRLVLHIATTIGRWPLTRGR